MQAVHDCAGDAQHAAGDARVGCHCVLLPDENRVGHLIEIGATERIFNAPEDPRTADYVTGRIG